MKKSALILASLLISFCVMAQKTVSGVVTLEDTGEPEPGVNVIVTGTSTGTITDIDGNYSLTVPEGKTISFSYIGYVGQTLKVNSGKIDVVMSPDNKILDEVVAVGYGTMKKSDLTGAISSVKSDALQKSASSGVDQALQGRAAGVTVNANSGQPGAAAEVRIRGIGTINNSSPIYVVDGIIVQDISYLSPSDIESTEILKDASSSAIYGSRAANGVILITTKKGREGKANISLNASAGFQNAWKKLSLMKRDEYAKTLVDINGTASEKALLATSFDLWLQQNRLGNSPYYPVNLTYSEVETDWQGEVFNENAPIQNYSLSVDGASDILNYALSANYFNQQGTIIGSDYERLSIRANSSIQATKWLKVGENVTFSTFGGRNATVNNASPGSSILSAALSMAPWDPAYYPQGSVNINGDDLSGRTAASSNFKNVVNPMTMVNESFPEDRYQRLVGDVFIELTPIKGLLIKSTASIDYQLYKHKLFKNKYEYSSFDKSNKNFLESSMANSMTFQNDNIIQYSRDIQKNRFSIMLGQSLEEKSSYSIGGSGASIPVPDKYHWYLSQTTEDRTYASDGASRTRMFSLFSRLFYSYDGKYMVTVNFRADNTSRFTENPWGYFPSAALSWNLSEEKFMKRFSKMDYLKIRGGWGMLGNQEIGQDDFTQLMFTSGPTFVDYILGADQLYENALGATVLTYVNTGGKWETTSQWNVGIDFGFWNGMLTGTIDGYIRNTSDMLMSVNAPAQVGNRYSAIKNVGSVLNEGIELSLGHRNSVGDFSYSIDGNISFVKNELTALNGGSTVYLDGIRVCDEGLPLYTIWGYKYLGVYKSNDEASTYLPNSSIPVAAGDSKYEDLNGDGNIDDADKTNLGNPFPWLTYGLNFSADYKGFDLQLFFQGVVGNELYNALRVRTEGSGTECTLSTTMRDVWSTSNPNGSIPNPTNSYNSQVSSRFVESGDYFRLKNLQLGYTVPKRIMSKAHINRLRFYVSISNLFTITGYSGYDPEVAGGVDYGNYPQARTFLFGLNLDF